MLVKQIYVNVPFTIPLVLFLLNVVLKTDGRKLYLCINLKV